MWVWVLVEIWTYVCSGRDTCLSCYIIVSLYLANRDFDPSNVIVSFQPMDDTACAEIAIADDSVSESREVFSVSISVPETDVTVTIGQPERAVVIINDLISELSTMVQFGVGSILEI